MRGRSEALNNLMLASAPLRRSDVARKLAPQFAETWKAVASGEENAPVQSVASETAKRLLKTALAICEAEGISALDLTQLYNDRRDDGEYATPAELDALLDRLAAELLAIMAGHSTKEAA